MKIKIEFILTINITGRTIMKKALLITVTVYSAGLFGMYGASNQWDNDNNLWSTSNNDNWSTPAHESWIETSNQDIPDTYLIPVNEYNTPNFCPSDDARDCEQANQHDHNTYVQEHFDAIDHEIVRCEVQAEK